MVMRLEIGGFAKLTRDVDHIGGTFEAGTLVKVTPFGQDSFGTVANVVMRDERVISCLPVDALKPAKISKA